MTDIVQERYINPYTDFGFKKFFEQAEIARYNPEERREYEESVKNFWDYYSTVKSALNRGRAEGRAEGERDRSIAIARNLKQMGMSVEDIAKATGIPIEDIAKLFH